MSAADWKPYDVPGVAGLLAEQPTDSGTHAMAWQEAYEMLTDQRQRLESARTTLLAAWPATPGSAAGSFFDQVDALTQAMRASAETAVNAHGALTGIVTAVDGASAKVDTLHRSWRQKQTTIGDFLPVDEWTRPLNNQAHVIMGQADAAIAEHATQLAPPVPFAPPNFSEPMKSISDGLHGNLPPDSLPTADDRRQMASARTSTVVLTTDGVNAEAAQRFPSDAKLSRLATNSALPSAEQTPTGSDVVEFRADPLGQRRNPTNVSQMPPREDTTGLARDASNATVRGASAENSRRVGAHGPAASATGQSRTLSTGRAGQIESMDAGAPASQGVQVGSPVDHAATGNPESRTANASGASTAPESAEYGGFLGGGLPMSGASGRSAHREGINGRSTWSMPVGVPAVILPAVEVAIRHDPGPGVIGIDR